jgi:hypothetical protein
LVLTATRLPAAGIPQQHVGAHEQAIALDGCFEDRRRGILAKRFARPGDG